MNLKDLQMKGKSALRAKNAKGHARGITAILSLSKSMILYSVLGMILNGLKLLETLKSMTRTKWRLIGLIVFHGSIKITSLYIMEKSEMFCHPNRSFDHTTDIQARKEPPSGPIYALSQKELSVLKEYITEMLNQAKICPSKSPAGAPILFVPKPHGRGLRLCVDYSGINMVTIMNSRPLPLMTEL